jgi:hypothetical protein
MGVTTITVSNKRDLLYVGSGDGTVALMDRTKLAFLKYNFLNNSNHFHLLGNVRFEEE